ncbi:MAG: alpha/beta fold hydrolase [Candidatus Promineifilaceae bacterium]
MNSFKGPMRPWPSLEPFSRTISLPKSQLDLFFFDSGSKDGSTFLLVHGLGDEADSWRHLFPKLAVNNRVLAVDLPGFGRSSLPGRSLSPPFLVAVLMELLDELNTGEVRLVGSSLGGVLCQQIALEHPERVPGLVLLDGSLTASGQALNLTLLLFMIPGVGEWMYNRLRRDPEKAFDTLIPYYADLEGLAKEDRDFLFQRVNQRVWSDRQRRAYFSVLRQLALWSPRKQKSLAERLGDCQVPTLAIWGERDAMISIEAAQTLLEIQPTARLVMIEGAGHLPHQDNPAAVLNAIIGDGRF